ncbi:MAG: hypothetical protein ACE5JG_03710, partial [Planctomycetota bacterium]
MTRLLPLLVLWAGAARAAPSRHPNYAESGDRKIYAFVFGSRDTCRVFRRSQEPPLPFAQMRRARYGATHLGEPGSDRLAEFRLRPRPIHLLPALDGRFLLAFANRALDGSAPTEDAVWLLGERVRSERLDYSGLPADPLPEVPTLSRVLGRPKKRFTFGEAEPGVYAF